MFFHRFLTSAEEFTSAINMYAGDLQTVKDNQSQNLVGWTMSWVNKSTIPITAGLIAATNFMIAAATSGQEGQSVMYLFFFAGFGWIISSAQYATAKKLRDYAISEIFNFTAILLQIVVRRPETHIARSNISVCVCIGFCPFVPIL